MSDEYDLVPPDKFEFPFPPYDIQEQFMTELFKALEHGKLGIFESPTGTGKSMSLICGALTWFLESEKNKRKKLEDLVANKNDYHDDGDDWFAAATVRQKHNQKRLEAKEELEQIKKKEEKLEKIKSKRKLIGKINIEHNKDEFDELFKEMKWIQKAVQKEISQGAGDDDLLVDEYVSDDDEARGGNMEEEDEDSSRKIYFCSRTHSQLSQFVQVYSLLSD